MLVAFHALLDMAAAHPSLAWPAHSTLPLITCTYRYMRAGSVCSIRTALLHMPSSPTQSTTLMKTSIKCTVILLCRRLGCS